MRQAWSCRDDGPGLAAIGLYSRLMEAGVLDRTISSRQTLRAGLVRRCTIALEVDRLPALRCRGKEL